uniref:MD-2-related lipid-recognition domain-containing protein n=2 Tax=Anopheles atroparvus TaxID=41427 RepID=A0A182JEN0_ANOAO
MHSFRTATAVWLSVLLMSHIWATEACNGGFQMVLHSIENCSGDGQIITIDPSSTVALTKECGVKSKSTMRTLGFSKAQMQISITKNGLPVVKESVDLCASLDDAASNPDAAELLTMFGVPDHCPVEATEITTDESKTYSLEKYKHNLLMAQGRSIIDILIHHDNGESCFKIETEITNKNILAL